jgi:alpha-tubulin suppressor-like RCC1 family protein
MGMFHQLGHPGVDNVMFPAVLSELKGSQVEQLALGSRHSLILRAPLEGQSVSVLAWGNNSNGQVLTIYLDVYSFV